MVTIAVYLHLYVTVLLQQGEYLLQFGGFRGGDGVFVEAEIDDGEGCERIGRFGCHGGIGCIRNCGLHLEQLQYQEQQLYRQVARV